MTNKCNHIKVFELCGMANEELLISPISLELRGIQIIQSLLAMMLYHA